MNLKEPLTAFVGASLFSMALTIGTASRAAAEDLEFYLSNETSVVLMEMYVSPTHLDDWEEDILGIEVVEPGAGGWVTIADGRETCIYDILGVFADGDEVDEYGIDLCELESYTFYEE